MSLFVIICSIIDSHCLCLFLSPIDLMRFCRRRELPIFYSLNYSSGTLKPTVSKNSEKYDNQSINQSVVRGRAGAVI